MRKPIVIAVVLVAAAMLIKQKDMTWRQSLLKTLYPLIMLKGKLFGNKQDIKLNPGKVVPATSFYELQAVRNNGDTLHFSTLKGKKVLIVNTASDCGFTGQYEALEKLHRQYGNQLVILGFPANDFKEQEKQSDTAIAEFCTINYGVSFPLMQKSSVVNGPAQHAVYQWLSHATSNGWNNQPPVWNFSKYLVDEEGVLVAFYTQMVSPLDPAVTGQLK